MDPAPTAASPAQHLLLQLSAHCSEGRAWLLRQDGALLLSAGPLPAASVAFEALVAAQFGCAKALCAQALGGKWRLCTLEASEQRLVLAAAGDAQVLVGLIAGPKEQVERATSAVSACADALSALPLSSRPGAAGQSETEPASLAALTHADIDQLFARVVAQSHQQPALERGT